MAKLSRGAIQDFKSDKLASAILLARAAVELSAGLGYLCAKLDAALKARFRLIEMLEALLRSG